MRLYLTAESFRLLTSAVEAFSIHQISPNSVKGSLFLIFACQHHWAARRAGFGFGSGEPVVMRNGCFLLRGFVLAAIPAA